MYRCRDLYNQESAGKPFGLISHFYDYLHDQLPALPDHFLWTPTLIGELLSREGKYRIIGSKRNAFVSIPNSYGIETLDDLLYYVLSNDYDGAANINVLVADMREVGILKKDLSPMMLGTESRVVIDGNVVQLAELRDRAKRT